MKTAIKLLDQQYLGGTEQRYRSVNAPYENLRMDLKELEGIEGTLLSRQRDAQDIVDDVDEALCEVAQRRAELENLLEAAA